jgi:hypothetical protein
MLANERAELARHRHSSRRALVGLLNVEAADAPSPQRPLRAEADPAAGGCGSRFVGVLVAAT